MSPAIEIIGLLAGSLALIAWIPQHQTVWKHQKHQGVNLTTLRIIFTALIIWFIYGMLKQAWAVCISNLVSGTLVCSIMCRVQWLRRHSNTDNTDTPDLSESTEAHNRQYMDESTGLTGLSATLAYLESCRRPEGWIPPEQRRKMHQRK